MDVLYSTGRFVTTYFQPGRIHLQYVKGPFLDVEERIQVAGLPSALRVGAPVSIGPCQGWVGTYGDGQRWLAFAHRKVSVLMTTKGLSLPALTHYAARNVCP